MQNFVLVGTRLDAVYTAATVTFQKTDANTGAPFKPLQLEWQERPRAIIAESTLTMQKGRQASTRAAVATSRLLKLGLK